MRLILVSALTFLVVSSGLAQSPLEELERRLESGRLAPREPGFLGLTADNAGLAGRGLRVEGVRPGSPAEAAGLRVGDVLLELERRPLRTLDDMAAVLQFRAPGESVNLSFERDGERHVVTARLAPRPAASQEITEPTDAAPPRIDTPPAAEPGAEFLPPPVESVVPFPKPNKAPDDGEELESLRREAAELRRLLTELQRRLADLESRLGVEEP